MSALLLPLFALTLIDAGNTLHGNATISNDAAQKLWDRTVLIMSDINTSLPTRLERNSDSCYITPYKVGVEQ